MPGQEITFDHVMSQTGLTYPSVTRNLLTGENIKIILEDVADNLFNDDPYYQQGGDMVRVGGLKFSIDPTREIGKRITYMELNDEPLDANKKYAVAGWASVTENVTGPKIWDVVAGYLRDKKTVKIDHLNTPEIESMKGNPGLA